MKKKDKLELLADELLSDFLKDTKKNKMRTSDCPILSDSQLKRRASMEIPFSNLRLNQRIELKDQVGLETFRKEVEND